MATIGARRYELVEVESLQEVNEMAETLTMKVYGAWLFSGKWDRKTPPPDTDWRLLTMKPGRYNKPPRGMIPKGGQVLLLMQGGSCLVVTPD